MFSWIAFGYLPLELQSQPLTGQLKWQNLIIAEIPTFLKYITNEQLKKGWGVDGLVQENVGNGGNLSVNKWIKQLEPGFLPQQIVSLEETGEDMKNAYIWISASKKKMFRSEMEKKNIPGPVMPLVKYRQLC